MRLPALVSAFVFCALPAFAAEFVAVPEAALPALEFDVADGYFQETQVPIACPINAVRATVTFTRFGQPTTQFKPGVTVVVISGKNAVSFHSRANQYRPPFTGQLARYEGDRGATEKLEFTTPYGAEGVFSILVSWTKDGAVTARVGDEEHSMPVPGPIDGVQITGSTGAGTVSAIERGYMSEAGAGPSPCPSHA